MTLKDVQDKLAALTTDVTALTSVDQSAVALLNGLSAIIADLRKQLAAAVAANDPAALQAVVDGLTAAHDQISAQSASLAAAVTANTPA